MPLNRVRKEVFWALDDRNELSLAVCTLYI